jgi:hypothetical protein
MTIRVKAVRKFPGAAVVPDCCSLEGSGRELTGKVPSLLGYQVKVIETAGPSRGPLRLPTANEFGARMLHVGQPEVLFVPALTE